MKIVKKAADKNGGAGVSRRDLIKSLAIAAAAAKAVDSEDTPARAPAAPKGRAKKRWVGHD